MGRVFFLISVSLALASCATSELRDMSADQAATVTDFEYRMVLDNIAMFRAQPASLPWHVTLSAGTAQVDESVNPSFSYAWSPVTRTLGLSGTADVTVNWTLQPVTNDEQLGALRDAYRNAAGRDFSQIFEEGSAAPSSGPYGHYGSEYVWPKDFDRFVQLILALNHTILIHPADEPGFKPAVRPTPGVALTPRH
ncbi:MAG TPA: hypothetical protein VGM17_02535 [Rhizomicrobium sp.]|jgi:hypothetical protein